MDDGGVSTQFFQPAVGIAVGIHGIEPRICSTVGFYDLQQSRIAFTFECAGNDRFFRFCTAEIDAFRSAVGADGIEGGKESGIIFRGKFALSGLMPRVDGQIEILAVQSIAVFQKLSGICHGPRHLMGCIHLFHADGIQIFFCGVCGEIGKAFHQITVCKLIFFRRIQCTLIESVTEKPEACVHFCGKIHHPVQPVVMDPFADAFVGMRQPEGGVCAVSGIEIHHLDAGFICIGKDGIRPIGKIAFFGVERVDLIIGTCLHIIYAAIGKKFHPVSRFAPAF